MKGKKTGGRKKGTPNKSSFNVQELCEKHGFDPIEGLIRIAKGEKILCGVATIAGVKDAKHRPTLAQILKARSELAEYTAPKRKAIEVTGEMNITSGPLPEEDQALLEQYAKSKRR